MTHYNGSVPETKRKPDWRDQGACREANNDKWFPQPGSASAVRDAKAVCFGCSVIFQCAQYALRTRQADGVWGGLSEGQRTTLIKNHRDADLDNLNHIRQLVLRALQPELNPVRSLCDLWEDNTRTLPDGHIGWASEATHVTYRGVTYTPKQLAFIVDRGQKAVGVVRRLPECPVVECIHPQHIADNEERFHRKKAEEHAAAQAAARAQYAAAEGLAS